jgi:signal transduction histidine kinase
MQIQHEQSQDEVIRSLQCENDALAAANDLLQEQLARKEQFIAMIAHEMRNPITPIISYAQMMARPASTPETIQRGSKVIVGQARRLTRLAYDLLDASRLTSGHFTLVRRACDIAELAKKMVEELRPLAPYHTLVIETPDTPVIGNWDSDRLQQALGNLLDNAIKYSDAHTTITLRVETEQDLAHISINNQGPGISAEDIGLLFHLYARLQATSDREGSGLGLYITRNIVEAHGGILRLEPHILEGQGTTFSFDLPLY